MMNAPATITYASVVSRDKVKVSLKITSLNDLDVYLGHIINMSVQSPNTDKECITLGPEFGKKAKKTSVIVRALQGLKSERADF